LGENPNFVFNTGCPSIDLAKQVIENSTTLPFNPYEKYGGVGAAPNLSNGYLVVMQHPVTNEYQDSRIHIETTLKAVSELNRPTLWFWPNVDAGADGTSTGIRSFREKNQLPNVHFFKNMEGKDFLHVLNHSDCLIGNSSVGIRECAYLGVPTVNIGSRQNRRERGTNVLDVDYNKEAIAKAIQNHLQAGKTSKSNIYGGGDAGNKIANLLEQLPLQFHKTIEY
jgi:UDP-hydrolysing UDP-N-acetyl-D-glucosamine 2-epimerase